jgi:hypothetical protein
MVKEWLGNTLLTMLQLIYNPVHLQEATFQKKANITQSFFIRDLCHLIEVIRHSD